MGSSLNYGLLIKPLAGIACTADGTISVFPLNCIAFLSLEATHMVFDCALIHSERQGAGVISLSSGGT